MNTIDRARAYLAKVPGAVSGQAGHDQTFAAAMALAHGFCLPEGNALALLAGDYNPRCAPPWSPAQLRHKVQSACRTTPAKPRGWLLAGRPRPIPGLPSASPIKPLPRLSEVAFDEGRLRALAAKLPGVGEEWLWERSPIRPDTQNAGSFLGRLYRPGERVAVFTRMESKSPARVVTIHLPWRGLEDLAHNQDRGVWFLANPIDGAWHTTDGGGKSMRCAAAVTSFRFAVLESDCAAPELWLPALAQLPIRIAAIYTSGKRSIHALWQIDAASKSEWDAAIVPLKPALKVLGADPGALSAVRLTRLPGCERTECAGLQRLLYLAPRPVDAPLAEVPIRETRQAMHARLTDMQTAS